MKTAIVTGSYGYIGSVLCKLLRERGYYVVGIDNSAMAQFDWFHERERVDSLNEYLCDDFASPHGMHVLKEYKDATVFHLAANSLLGPSAFDPLSYYENNAAKTLKLLQTLKPSNRLIFASTAAVYGITDKPVREKSKIDPPNNYGQSKLWCEHMIDSCYEIHNLKATSFRFFNVVGAYKNVGQLPETPHIINQLCDRAMNDEEFTINGDDFETKDGTCIRDYVHVIDICNAMIYADEYMRDHKKPMHEKFNLGTNSGQSVKEIVDIFQKTCYDVPVKIGPKRVGDPPFLVADPNKFIKKTGFMYEHSSNLEAMIKSAWEYRSGRK
jgi:UDP-glucose 4-epimerase